MTPPIDAPTTWARSTPGRVEHLDGVERHPDEVVRAGRSVGVAGAAVVDGDAVVPAAERAALERPSPSVHAEALDHQHGRAVPLAPNVVRDAYAVTRDDLAHSLSLTLSVPGGAHCRIARARTQA